MLATRDRKELPEETTKNRRRVPFEKRKRASASCDQCKLRRVKCQRWAPEAPCDACTRGGQECVTSLPRKKRIYSSVDEARYRAVDTLLQKLFPNRSLDTAEQIYQLIKEVDDNGSTVTTLTNGKSDTHSILSDSSNTSVSRRKNAKREGQSVVHNTDGRSRYIGPSGTLFFLSQLKKLLSKTDRTSPGGNEKGESIQQAYALEKRNDIIPVPELPSPDFVNRMLSIYFESIHPDMMIFNQTQFSLEVNKLYTLTNAPAATVCAVFAVFVSVLDCQTGDFSEQRTQFWSVILKNLHLVVSGSGLRQIQCLMLLAQIFHNSNERNTTWNLIGVAVRIAYSMGLHREGAITTTDGQDEKETKRIVWWTLYCYERFLSVSLGRPSTIEDSWINIEFPKDIYPLIDGYTAAQCRIFKFVGHVCETIYHPEQEMLPSSIARNKYNDIHTWFEQLPSEITDSSRYAGQKLRAVLLLKVYYYWATTLLTRPYFMKVEQAKHDPTSGAEDFDSDDEYLRDRCYEDSVKSVRVLSQEMWLSSTFNSRSWLDVFFAYSSVCILAASMLRRTEKCEDTKADLEGCLTVFESCHLNGTMARFASVSKELSQLISEIHGTCEEVPYLQGPLNGANPNNSSGAVDVLDYGFHDFHWLYSMDTL
uniref:ARAD1D27962p n=1 Tax=Blastobotrys adeninivorans TaxID=409370 RepID=A0A060TG49_BLAAD